MRLLEHLRLELRRVDEPLSKGEVIKLSKVGVREIISGVRSRLHWVPQSHSTSLVSGLSLALSGQDRPVSASRQSSVVGSARRHCSDAWIVMGFVNEG